MPDDTNIFVFGDQTADPRERLREQLLAGRTNLLLGYFIHRVDSALKHEISQLPWPERSSLPNYSSIEQLSKSSSTEQIVHPGLLGALLCVSQLAQYFEYEHQRTLLVDILLTDCPRFASINQQHTRVLSNTVVVGLCTGLLAGAAIASAPVLSGLVRLGAEVVLIAFRVGTYVHRIALQIEIPEAGANNSWSTAVGGTTRAEAHTALAQFHQHNVRIIFFAIMSKLSQFAAMSFKGVGDSAFYSFLRT